MSTVPESQREFAVDVVRKLRAAGHEAYWAGGCVRDQLLGKCPKDYDVATSARPDAIREIFGRRRTVAVGAAFGVITVLGPKPAGQIEVATFRSDVSYSDGRHPDAIVFSSPQEDAQRRDFTINGLFLDPISQTVLDFVGGQQDLTARVVRAIGDPAARFTEDKLRMLRAVRFAAALDFELEPQTASAIRAMAGEITVVSPERIAAELRRMLEHPSRRRAIESLKDLGLLAVVLPELKHWRGETRERTLVLLASLREPEFPLALATILWQNTSQPEALELAQRLRLSNRETAGFLWLLENAEALRDARQQPWAKVQRILIAEGANDLLEFTRALSQHGLASTDDVEFCFTKLRLPKSELNPPALINGNDLVQQGVRPGRAYQQLLEAVRDAQLEGRVANKAEALALVKELRKSESGNVER